MRVEGLTSNTGEVFAGVAELRNEQHQPPDDLIQIARVLASNVLAIQFLNPQCVAGELHLLSAAQNAWNAWSGDYAIARALDVEIILYASAQRQIKTAFAVMGLESGLDSVGVVVVAESKQSAEDALRRLEQEVGANVENPFQMSDERLGRIQHFFKIPESEMDAIAKSDTLGDRWTALVRCVVSRVSLVATEA
ncbi:hypothetical protein EU520_01295 [Candidatus Thorarchaeota archaeon]|nr:MAG: hypothetical protein EU520_01295 [Candidatus Thorarchaeota archaeon]